MKRLGFNHEWNMKAAYANNGDKDWGTTDVRELEKIKTICLEKGFLDPLPELKVVERLSDEERRRLNISKLPLEAAAALGEDIPASCWASAPAAKLLEDDEAAFCESRLF